jgi:chemotaxis protein methyltransferase CheR
MMLAEMARERGGFPFAILGTDISVDVVQRAKRAVYSESMIEPIPEHMRRRYLMKGLGKASQTEYRIVPEIRRHCRFERLNLMDPSFPFDDDIDVIFLRNVLIYFDRPTQQGVIARVVNHLRPGGYLLLGHSESLIGGHSQLRQVASATFQRV